MGLKEKVDIYLKCKANNFNGNCAMCELDEVIMEEDSDLTECDALIEMDCE